MPIIFLLCQSNVLFTYLQTVLLLAKWIWSAIFLNNSWLIPMYHLTSLYFDLLFVNLLSCKILTRWVPSTTFLKKMICLFHDLMVSISCDFILILSEIYVFGKPESVVSSRRSDILIFQMLMAKLCCQQRHWLTWRNLKFL